MKIHRETVIGLLDNTKRQLPVIKLALNEVIEVTNCLNDRYVYVHTSCACFICIFYVHNVCT